MAPIHPRSTDGLIAQLAKKVQQLQSARALGPILPFYTFANLPANPPRGLEVYVTDLGLRAWYNGAGWVFPPQLISQQVLAAPAASVPIAIPAVGFSTLRVVWSGASTDATSATYLTLRLNGDTGSNYLFEYGQINTATPGGGNSSGVTDRIRVGTMPAVAATAGYVGAGEFAVAAASGSTYKAVSGRSTSVTSTTAGFSGTYGGLWLNTAVVSSLTLLPASGGNLLAGTSISVYGE